MLAVLALHLLRVGLDTPLTLDCVDTLLPEVLTKVATDCGLNVTAPSWTRNLKVTILVKDMKARALLDRIGSLYSLGSTVEGRNYTFTFDRLDRIAFSDYMDAENGYQANVMLAKLDALAKLTQKPFGQPLPDESVSELRKPGEEETPEHWARRKIGQPAYYALGMWQRQTRLEHPAAFRDSRLWCDAMSTPLLFIVTEPHGNPASKIFPVAFIDERSKELRDTAIVLNCYPSTADIGVTTIHGPPAENDPLLPQPFLLSHPPKALQNLTFAKKLADWEEPLDKLPSDLLEAPLKKTDPPKDPGYFDGRFSLTEKLEYLHTVTGIPLIATSFRVPALNQGYPDGDKARDILEDLTEKEDAIIRYDDGCLMVRHPAYWRFECSEPPEQVIAAAEEIAKQRLLTPTEYGMLARGIATAGDGVAPWMQAGFAATMKPERLPNVRGLLVRLDPEPLVKAFPALLLLGGLTATERSALFAGEVLDTHVTTGYIAGAPHLSVGSYTKVRIGGKDYYGTTTPTYSSRDRDMPVVAVNGRLMEPTRYAPDYPAEVSDQYITTADRMGLGLGPESRYLWLETQDSNSYAIYLGWKSMPVATYRFSIHPKPQKADDGG